MKSSITVTRVDTTHQDKNEGIRQLLLLPHRVYSNPSIATKNYVTCFANAGPIILRNGNRNRNGITERSSEFLVIGC